VVITQNIDELHRKAGTKNLLEIHGEGIQALNACSFTVTMEDTCPFPRMLCILLCALWCLWLVMPLALLTCQFLHSACQCGLTASASIPWVCVRQEKGSQPHLELGFSKPLGHGVWSAPCLV
jgi:hypothetical protein